MTKTVTKLIARTLPLFALVSAAQGGVFTDNFSTSHNYQANGVVGTNGNTLWDGVTFGHKTPAIVYGWDASTTAAGTLTITNQGGNWGGNDDGPFLWKNVKGDFTNTVKVTGFLCFKGYNNAGLLVRDPHPTNGENYYCMGEFGHPEWGVSVLGKQGTDGSLAEFGNSSTTYTNLPVWLQITRVGTVMTANVSSDGSTWEYVNTTDRPDLPDMVQVGIFNSNYSDQDTYAQYQDFFLDGTIVNSVGTPPSQATGLTLTPGVGVVTANWTAGAGSAGSVVVMRKGLGIFRQPVNGTNYTGSATFGSGSNLGENNVVVYSGSGTSVTVTNLDPATPYTVAVYACTGSAESTVYAFNPPVKVGATEDVMTGITINFGWTNAVAVDDTLTPALVAHYITGNTLPVTSGFTLGSGNPGIASVNGLVISGLSAGTVAINASYSGFNTSSNLIVAKLPVTDDFTSSWDYLDKGIAGTTWNGLLLGAADIPAGGVTDGGKTLIADANISKAGRLTVRSTLGGFDTAKDDGFFLYRLLEGDFSISIQLTGLENPAYHMPGIMVRLPFEMAGVENSLAIVAFNEFGIGDFVRVIDGGFKSEVAQQWGAVRPFMKIARVGDSFLCYVKDHALDPWSLIYSNTFTAYTGQAAQVGIVQGIYTANSATAEFDNLTIEGAAPGTPPSPATGLTLTQTSATSATATWTAGAGSSGSVVILHPLCPATRQPAYGADYSGIASPDFSVDASNIGGTNKVVLAGSETSVSISNLSEDCYYATVYSYATANGTNSYSLVNPPVASVNLLKVTSQYVEGGLQITWPYGTLLQATNIMGPWIVNTNVSPYVNTNILGDGALYYRIQLR